MTNNHRRGIPYGRKTVEHRYGDPETGDWETVEKRRFRMFHILWPLKMMTVLFHEVSGDLGSPGPDELMRHVRFAMLS